MAVPKRRENHGGDPGSKKNEKHGKMNRTSQFKAKSKAHIYPNIASTKTKGETGKQTKQQREGATVFQYKTAWWCVIVMLGEQHPPIGRPMALIIDPEVNSVNCVYEFNHALNFKNRWMVQYLP